MNSIEFEKFCQENKLIFQIPTDYSVVPVLENNDVGYQFALKHKNIKFEVRYSIFLEKNYQTQLSNENLIKNFKLFSLTALKNIAHSEKIIDHKELDPQSVKNEFNADAGLLFSVEADSEFAKDYKYVQFYSLHKLGTATVFIFFLFDDGPSVIEQVKNATYCLKFS